jgi:hypothetical protein
MSHSAPAFKTVTPANASELIANRRGEFNSLRYDNGSFQILSPVRFRSAYSARYWIEFKVNGATFRRSVTEEAIGNFSVIRVNICGVRLQMYPA